MIIIETPGCTVRMDGDDLDADEVLIVWQSVRDRLHAEAVTGIRGGSVTGFVIEQADESLNNLLPGGGTR
jgi:hypothetical protein